MITEFTIKLLSTLVYLSTFIFGLIKLEKILEQLTIKSLFIIQGIVLITIFLCIVLHFKEDEKKSTKEYFIKIEKILEDKKISKF